ncbi:MAG: ATP-binding protein [Ahrensia sp.]
MSDIAYSGQSGLQMGTARRSVAIMLVSITALAIIAVFLVSLTYFKSLDREAADVRLTLYERSLNDTLERYEYFPFVLARDPLVIDALDGPPFDALNARLKQFAEKSDLEAIYLMDQSGVVLGASNFDQPHSFVGQNYGFRPYFKQAIAGKRGNFFGVGATTGRPGYFVSEPVADASGIIKGVISIKLDASELQQRWEAGGENVIASNVDGIVVLASNREWLFGSLGPLPPERLQALEASKQFGNEEVRPLAWHRAGAGAVRLDDESYIYAQASVEPIDWTIHYLLSEGRAYERALLTTIMFGAGISLLVGFATYLRSKRIQAALATSQSDRRKLQEANRQLENAQSELARASKLAALGQLSASVVHELGQPIAALRNYLAAEELDANGTPHPNQARLNSVVDRMEGITKQLRFFTKPGEQKLEPVLLHEVIAASVALMQHDFDMANIDLRLDIDQSLAVQGNRLRLEQVLVNLLKNALMSLHEAGNHNLSVSVTRTGSYAKIAVDDNGVGLGGCELGQMQEPFYTTRSSGDGMGLGLSITAAIIKEHNGTLSAADKRDGGAVFVVDLPISETLPDLDNE